MRVWSGIPLVGAIALSLVPSLAIAAPLRAGAALPNASRADVAAASRAATPVAGQSDLIGFPIFAFLGLFLGVGLVVVIASGGGRSPG